MTRIDTRAAQSCRRGRAASSLLRCLAMLALLLMPFGMAGGQQGAQAAPAAAAFHCIGGTGQQPAPRSLADRSADCGIACAALPTFGCVLPPPAMTPDLVHPLPIATGYGLAPEAATPPPRAG